jgi:hypothetical protein
LRAQPDRVGSVSQCFFIAPDDQLETKFSGIAIAELEHLAELVACIDMQQRKGNGGGIKGLLGQAQHHRRVLADRIKHDRILEL